MYICAGAIMYAVGMFPELCLNSTLRFFRRIVALVVAIASIAQPAGAAAPGVRAGGPAVVHATPVSNPALQRPQQQRRSLATQTGATLLSEGFSASATTPNAWVPFGGACLTAGTTATPQTSLPACGGAAPLDAIGQGALQLTAGTAAQAGAIVARTPLPTANGLQITFDDYAFNGTYSGANGLAFFLTDASKPLPTHVGASGSSLAYAPATSNAGDPSGVPNAYVGVGFDEFGGFSIVPGGPGRVRETITVRGAAATNYPYVGGYENAAGVAASLPFAFDAPTLKVRPVNVPTIRATLTAAGVLTVAIDRHDGNGFVLYYSHAIVGVGGQPAVPASVYFGLSASTGAGYNTHQVAGLVVSTLTAVVTPANEFGESFERSASTPGAWSALGAACLTAGTAATPATSIPACGVRAPQDASGSGALQLTNGTPGAAYSASGVVINRNALSTANGLQVTFIDYAFNGSYSGGNGVALFLTDASKPFPTSAGQPGGSLAYASAGTLPGIANAYVGIGLDEFGDFSAGPDGPGRVRESIAVRGAAATGYPYLGGAINALGQPASLPFSLDASTSATRPAVAPMIRATLTAAGILSVAINRHDGAGFATYYSQSIVGVNGQPAVPAQVYLGLSASIGGAYNVHQIAGLTVTTATGLPIASAADNPPQIVSSNGTLTFNVSAQQNATTGAPQFIYNGSAVPPTLRLLPGDTLVVNMTNNLPVPASGSGYTNYVNLHYHGLHVSPQAPSDDSIDMLAMPGQSLHYSIQIPANHPTGLYWYHTHAHGETERDTLSGMSGALIIDGIAAYAPQVAGVVERVLVARDAPLPGQALPDANPSQLYAMQWAMRHGVAMHASGGTVRTASGSSRSELHGSTTMQTRNPYVTHNVNYRRFIRANVTAAADSHCVAGSPENPAHALTINGQSQPAIRIAPGEQQFWRMVNAGADTYLDVAVDNTTMQIVAIDGVPLSMGVGTPASMAASHWLLPPGSRVEFLVTGPAAGTPAYLRTNCVDSGSAGAAMPAEILGTIDPTPVVAGAARNAAVARIAPHATRFRYHTASRIRTTAVAATRTVYYSDQNNINGVGYDPAAPPMFYVQSGTVEEWTIQNNSSQIHTFHIHQIHFLVEAINGTPQAQEFLMDNVNVPAATASGPGTVKLLLDFTDPLIVGTFLMHCHILSHEDGGMMAKVRVGLAPPLGLSATSVNFANPTAAVQKVTISGGAQPYSVTGCTGVANGSVSGTTITLVPVASGACLLTVADASSPSLTATIAIQVGSAAPVVTLSQTSLAFAAPNAAAQSVTISGGTAPYSATGCTSIATASIAGDVLTVTPAASGTCTFLVSDANGNQASLSISVNTAAVNNNADALTFHGNSARTGWYQNETTLTVANVASGNFGHIATLAAPAGMPGFGKVYAQPLFVTNEKSIDGNTHNLVIVAGAADQVYAFDESTHAVVWHRDFTNTAAGIRQQLWSDTGCSDVNPDVGIIGTPVIDRTRDAVYVVVATMENGVPYTRLHAIGLGSGTDLITPTVITGTATLTTGGTASVSSLGNMNRAALLEANGNVYVTLGSHCDSSGETIHGWVLAYSAATLQETGSIVDLSNANLGTGFLAAVWMSGFGPASDAQGNIYLATGNGPFNGSTDLGMSIIRLPGNLNLSGASYFSPIQEAADSGADEDLGAGGVMVLPDQTGTYPHLLVGGGKCSANALGCFKYILNRDSLGGQQAGNAGAVWSASTGGGIWGGPAYFVDSKGVQHILYGGNPLNTYNLSTSPVGLTVLSSTAVGCLECRDQGSQPIVSSNATTAGSAVVWALKTPGNGGGNILLYAFNPLSMGTPLYYGVAGTWTQAAGTSWIAGALVSPLVANGRVYVPSDGSVSVFGLTQATQVRMSR